MFFKKNKKEKEITQEELSLIYQLYISYKYACVKL